METASTKSSQYSAGYSVVGLQLSATFSQDLSEGSSPGLSIPDGVIDLKVHPESLEHLGYVVTPDNSAYAEILELDKRITIELLRSSFQKLMDDLTELDIPIRDASFSLDSLTGFHFQVNPYTARLMIDYNISSLLQSAMPAQKREIVKYFNSKYKGTSVISNLLSMGKLSPPKCDMQLWIAYVVDHLAVLKTLREQSELQIEELDYEKLIDKCGIRDLGSILEKGYAQKDACRDIYIIYVMLKIIESGIPSFAGVAKKKIASYGGTDSVRQVLSWDFEGEDESIRNEALLILNKL